MKYAVEARIFDNGRIVTKIRPADDGEESSYSEMRTCDIWIDIFDNLKAAENFARDYKRA